MHRHLDVCTHESQGPCTSSQPTSSQPWSVHAAVVRAQQPVRMVAAAEVVSAVDAIHTTSMMLSDATAATDSSLTAFLAQLIAVGPVGIAVVAASVALVIGVAYTLANAFVTDVLPVVLQIGAFVAFIEFFGVVPPPL